MSYTSQLNAVTQLGRGIVGQILGNHYNVYRLTSQSGSVVSGSPVITGYQAKLQRAQRQAIEVQTFELEVFEAKCDNTTLQFGDVLVGTDPADLATYVFAQFRDFQPTLFIRCEKTVNVFRPQDDDAQAPGSFTPGPGQPYLASGFDSSDSTTQLELQLTAGTYSFVAQGGGGSPALVPMGLQITARAGGPRASNDLPTSTTTARFVAYLPPLGVTIEKNDVIHIDDDHEYIVNSADEISDGFVGTIMVLEQTGVGA